MTFNIPSDNPSKTTTNALRYTESNGCGYTMSYTCFIGGAACPSWISFSGSKNMVVTNPGILDVGNYSVKLKSFFTDPCGNTNFISD